MSGVHSRRTVAARSGLAKTSRPHSAETGNRQAIAVAPGTLGMLPRSQTAPQTQSSSADTQVLCALGLDRACDAQPAHLVHGSYAVDPIAKISEFEFGERC